jgi:uncharacterized phiE125 gp8 family phage protein
MTPITKLTTPPAQRVISLQALKDFLRVDTSADDLLLTNLLKAAEKRLEAFCEVKFVTQTWEIYYDHFPYGYKSGQWWDGTKDMAISELRDFSGGELTLPFGPVQSITSITYFKEDDTSAVFAGSNYVVDAVGNRGRIALRLGKVWPADVLLPINAVKVEGIFGFGAGYIASPEAQSQVPEDIQEAVKNFCAVLYEHRGDEMPDIPSNVVMLLQDYMRYRV